MTQTRRPLPSLPAVSDASQRPSSRPVKREHGEVYEKFQESLTKLSDAGSELDEVRREARKTLSPKERDEMFDGEEVTGVTVIPPMSPKKK